MKIFRCAGSLATVVGVLCVLLILPAARADAQGAELSGAVKAVRQAEKQTDDREAKSTLGEAGKSLKRAEKLATKGQTGPLLDEITAVRTSLAGLLDQPETASSPTAPLIEKAVGLIDDAIRKAGRYQTTTDTALGLHTTTLASLHGTVRIYLPEDIRIGDTISGTVEIAPAGATPEERRRNGATLSGVVVAIEEEQTPASDGFVRWQVPMIETSAAVVVLRDPSGAEVGRATVPVNPEPGGLGPLDQPLPGDYELPPIVQFGNPFTIAGPFDGEFETTALDCGGELTLLAESPRTLIARAPLDLVGRHTMTLSEDETIIAREVNVIQLFLSAGKLDLLRGETTTVTAEVIGFAGLDPEAYPIEFEMVNHSPETVTMEGLEDNRFYQLIFADDISILEDVSTAEGLSTDGSFVVESTLHGIHTGTFDISATVTSPILFDIYGPGAQLACTEEKRFRLLCVRFIVIDEPGAKDRTTDGTGLLKGVKYNGKNIGEVSEATVAKARATLEKANAIWLQCFAHCCWIRFDLHSEDGKPAVYALDPSKPLVTERTRKILYGPRYWDVKWTRTIDLTQLLDNQNSRDLTMRGGNAQVKIKQEATWNEDVGSKFKKDDSATETLEKNAQEAEKEGTKKRYEQLAKKDFTAPSSVLWMLGLLIDQELGEKCINIFLVNSLDDTKDPGDESGFAERPGRNLILEDAELDSATGAVLAHELGHNLSLEHVKIPGMLMNEGNAGTTLIEKECDDACKMATNEALKPAALPDGGTNKGTRRNRPAHRRDRRPHGRARGEDQGRGGKLPQDRRGDEGDE